MTDTNTLQDIADFCVTEAVKRGADAADIAIFDETNLSVRTRLGTLETIEQAGSTGVGIRVLVGKKGGYKQAMVSSSDTSRDTLTDLIDTAISMANIAPADPYLAMAEPDQLATTLPDLDTHDTTHIEPETLIALCKETEEAALAVDGITNSEGAEGYVGRSHVAFALSNGFRAAHAGSSHSLSASVIAGEGTNMEVDYAYSAARHASDLTPAAEIGIDAANRANQRLNSRKKATCQVPVIFENRTASHLLSSLAGAINGASIARGTSFLQDMLGEQIFGEHITIIDDPLMKRGLASESFDAEGLPRQTLNVVENGTLTTWLTDLRSANQLGLESTGHASRGLGSAPSPASSNFYMQAGTTSVADLIGDIKDGFFVTDVFGMGINGVTGDYSQGAAGLWIESGELAYSVSEMTIAGNLKDMFKALTPADDLVFLGSKNSPSVRVDGLTVAGV